MRAITKIALVTVLAGATTAEGCGQVPVDTVGGFPPAGVIRGTVLYDGPLPCSQGGHVVGNAILFVFDARNPPPPAGLANTAVNFGVVPGDALFHDSPVTQGAAKVCPPAETGTHHASAPFAISPMPPGAYVIQAFFDYTGNFVATLAPRNLPEADDVGGGYVDLDEATSLVPDVSATPTVDGDGGSVYPLEPARANPNYAPTFLPVNVGVPGAVPPTSHHGVPEFSMPPEGFLADNVNVTIGARLSLSRPYFYPEGVVLPSGQSNANVTIDPEAPSSAGRPADLQKTAQNPSGNVDFIPVLSFPQDILVYAQPTASAIANFAHGGRALLDGYQAGFPQLTLHAGVPSAEQRVAGDTVDPRDPFHLQLGLPNPPPGAAPGGNGGLFVWWNRCDGLPGCQPDLEDFIPESDQIYRMWPLVVLAKIEDLPRTEAQPSSVDPASIVAQGADAAAPVVIIQGITLFEDSLVATTTSASLLTRGTVGPPGAAPSRVSDHVSAMVRPSTLCLDPRAPDNGGILVTPGASIDPKTESILGPYPPNDSIDGASGEPGIVIDAHVLSNPQLSKLVNRAAAGSTNGLLAGCLPTGRYEINLVYPTGQAWTTPNAAGACEAGEGKTIFTGTTAGSGLLGRCATKPRPALYSQGTRAVVEITPTTSPTNCRSAHPTDGSIPAVPFACTALCADPHLDSTASVPCSVCLDGSRDPEAVPPCSAPLQASATTAPARSAK